ncbi:MAG: hypothetical protein M3188_09105 [Actinomycetota bacterium]|nr:hypothetical protein [Actinomycetota bacterium]
MPAGLVDRPRSAETSDRTLAELEALWAADIAPEDAGRSGAAWPYRELRAVVVWGWPAVLLTVALFAPAPAPGAAYAGWVVAASVALVLGPLVAGLVGIAAPFAGLALSAALGGLGVAVGIACRATAHHAGAWWGVETGLFAGLAAASLACLALRRRA